MFSLDMLWNARWDELYLFLIRGNPPIIAILLGVNTLFFMAYIIRRSKQKHSMRPSTVYFVQSAVVAANMFVLFREDAVRYIMMMKGIL